jgi:hypothetical protein
LTYLNIPILLKYQLPVGVNLFAGPQIGILAGGKLEEEDKASGDQDTAINRFNCLICCKLHHIITCWKYSLQNRIIENYRLL